MERKIRTKRKFSAGYPCGHPTKNFGQALQILENKAFGTDIPCGRPRKNFGLKNFGLNFRSLYEAWTDNEEFELLCEGQAMTSSRQIVYSFTIYSQRKTKWQQLKGKIVSVFSHFSHLSEFCPQDFPLQSKGF